MAALLLANIHALDFKPAVTLTDLKDIHSIFWLNEFSIMYYAAPNAATAWALRKALLFCCLGLARSQQCSMHPPAATKHWSTCKTAKIGRPKSHVHRMRSSSGQLAQLAMISDFLSRHEVKRSAAACMIKQLLNMPAFYSEERLPSSVAFGMYSWIMFCCPVITLTVDTTLA